MKENCDVLMEILSLDDAGEIADNLYCKKCGCCCIVGAPRPIAVEDIEIIKKTTGLKEEDFVDNGNLMSPCIFLKKDGDEFKCIIYDKRPKLCEEFSSCKILTGEIQEEKIDDTIIKWHNCLEGELKII